MGKAENQFGQVEMITVKEVLKTTNTEPIFTANRTVNRNVQ
jgi:hypothetical protein